MLQRNLSLSNSGNRLRLAASFARIEASRRGLRATASIGAPRLQSRAIASQHTIAVKISFAGVLTPTGAGCEDAWVLTSMLVPQTERLTFIVAFRPAPNHLGTELSLRLKTPAPDLLTGALAFKILYRCRALLQTGEVPTIRSNPSARPSAR